MPALTDGQGRTVDALRLSITARCNERCVYCVGEGGARADGDELTRAELVEICRAAVALGVRKLRLTGGEPLLRADVATLCRELAALPGLDELCLTTNGLLLPDLADELRRAGVRRVNLSLDSLRPERYAALTRTGTLRQALAGLRAALDAGFARVKLNTVLLGGVNDDEIGDFIALTRELPLEARFLELMPMGACAGWPAERFLPAGEVLRRFPQLEPLPREGVAERYRMPGHAGTVGLIRPVTGCFCAACGRIRVTADGRLKPCLHGSLEVPLRGLHGDALLAALRAGVAAKPSGHALGARGSDAGRPMNQIGG